MKRRRPQKNALWFGYGCCLPVELSQAVYAWLNEARNFFTFPLLLDDDERTMNGAFLLVLGTSSVDDAHFLGVTILPEWVKTISDAGACVPLDAGLSVQQRWQRLQHIAQMTGLCVDLPAADFLLLREENRV